MNDETKEPTCRACYIKSLPEAQRDRVISEPITGPIYYCAEHKAIEQDIRSILGPLVDITSLAPDPLDVATWDFPKAPEPEVVQVDLSLALTPFAARRLREALARKDYHLHSLKFTSHSQRHLDDLNIPVAEVQGVQW